MLSSPLFAHARPYRLPQSATLRLASRSSSKYIYTSGGVPWDTRNAHMSACGGFCPSVCVCPDRSRDPIARKNSFNRHHSGHQKLRPTSNFGAREKFIGRSYAISGFLLKDLVVFRGIKKNQRPGAGGAVLAGYFRAHNLSASSFDAAGSFFAPFARGRKRQIRNCAPRRMILLSSFHAPWWVRQRRI